MSWLTRVIGRSLGLEAQKKRYAIWSLESVS